MEITSNTTPQINTVEVEFNINAENFESALQSSFLKKRKNIVVPGFRKGKATRKMIETSYGEGVFYEDAVNELYRDNIPKVVDELKLEIVDAPQVEVLDLNKEIGVNFKVVFTVKPQVSISGYKGVEVELEPHEVTEKDLDDELENMRAAAARIMEVTDRAVISGDVIKFDFEGSCDGEVFEGGTAEGFELEIGSGKFIPGFEEQIIGRNIGEEFDVNVTFPSDYGAAYLQGKDAVFKCRIHEISGKEMAELDDEFAKDVSEYDTLAELREDVRGHLSEQKEKERDLDLEREVAEKIIVLIEAEIPPVMFEDRIDELARDWSFKYNLLPEEFAKRSNMSLDEFRDGFREVAEKQVKFRLSLEKIADLESIQVNETEIDEEYAKMAEQNKMTAEKVREFVTVDAVTSDVKTEKALKLIKEKAVVKIKEKVEAENKE